MNYDFSFNKKTISLLLAGSTFTGILLFVAGLLVGTSWKTEQTPVAVVAAKPPVAAPAPEPTVAPQEPVMRAEAVVPKSVERSEAGALPDDPALVRQSHSSTSIVNSRRTQAMLPVPQNDGEIKIIQQADRPEDETGETPSFAVQVGVFTTKNDANQLVRVLQSKGYAPIVLTANDDDDRTLYAVRIGSYANKTEATEASSMFTRQEKIQTIVRPLGSL